MMPQVQHVEKIVDATAVRQRQVLTIQSVQGDGGGGSSGVSILTEW